MAVDELMSSDFGIWLSIETERKIYRIVSWSCCICPTYKSMSTSIYIAAHNMNAGLNGRERIHFTWAPQHFALRQQ